MSVCVCVCACMCVSVCVCVHTITKKLGLNPLETIVVYEKSSPSLTLGIV